MNARVHLSFTRWEDAAAEALRVNAVCVRKFGGTPSDWRYRVRKRRVGSTHHVLWKVYTPHGQVPRS